MTDIVWTDEATEYRRYRLVLPKANLLNNGVLEGGSQYSVSLKVLKKVSLKHNSILNNYPQIQEPNLYPYISEIPFKDNPYPFKYISLYPYICIHISLYSQIPFQGLSLRLT